MAWTTGMAMYFVIWWVVLFAALPFGVRQQEQPQAGLEPGAPEKPLIWKKMAATTVIAAVLWMVIYLVAFYDVFNIVD